METQKKIRMGETFSCPICKRPVKIPEESPREIIYVLCTCGMVVMVWNDRLVRAKCPICINASELIGRIHYEWAWHKKYRCKLCETEFTIPEEALKKINELVQKQES